MACTRQARRGLHDACAVMPDQLTPVLTDAIAVEAVPFPRRSRCVVARHTPSIRARTARASCAVAGFVQRFSRLCVRHRRGRPFSPNPRSRRVFDPLLKKFSASPDTHLIVYGAAFQFGLLAGVAGAHAYLRTQRKQAEAPTLRHGAPSVLLAGVLTFLAVLSAAGLAGSGPE